MRNTILAAVIGAAITASIVVVVRPSGNEANAKVEMPKTRAECILRNLGQASTDAALIMLFDVCRILRG